MRRYNAFLCVLMMLPLPESASAAAAENLRGPSYVMFSINVQDFSYPEESASTVGRILDVHEGHKVPVDFYLTGTMVDLYESKAPGLLLRLKQSPTASVSYHVRPPCPYYVKYDWARLRELPERQQYETILRYETQGLDLSTGQTTEQPGGYQKLKQLLGYAPYVASKQAEPGLARASSAVFRDLGAKFFVLHGRPVNLAEKQDGVWLRPEHVDLRLFQQTGRDSAEVLQASFAEAQHIASARAPYFVGIKMHDNDFFAEKSAWVTVYMQGPRRPNWDLSRKAILLPEEKQKEAWKTYEAMVAYVVSLSSRVKALNAPMLLDLLEGRKPAEPSPSVATPKNPPSPQAGLVASDTKGPIVCVSGTMHIETNRRSWPDPDRLMEFFRRATAVGKSARRDSGMRWSIGADIGWLEGERRAAEIIKATEALGVQWDIHAHQMADRPACAAAITRFGGHANEVCSGLVAYEIEALRAPLKGRAGNTWQAQVLWGVVRRPNHGPGSDDNSFGLWRAKNGMDFLEHDANGKLVAVGGGTRQLAGAERLAIELGKGANRPPVTSATVMVSPRTFTVIGTNDGIEAIEAWAARMAKMPQVRWATISETASLWLKAGGVPSRTQ